MFFFQTPENAKKHCSKRGQGKRFKISLRRRRYIQDTPIIAQRRAQRPSEYDRNKIAHEMPLDMIQEVVRCQKRRRRK